MGMGPGMGELSVTDTHKGLKPFARASTRHPHATDGWECRQRTEGYASHDRAPGGTVVESYAAGMSGGITRPGSGPVSRAERTPGLPPGRSPITRGPNPGGESHGLSRPGAVAKVEDFSCESDYPFSVPPSRLPSF